MSTDTSVKEGLEVEIKNGKSIDELQDEIREKLANIQILTVKELKERGHNFHPCKYTKIVVTGEDSEKKSIGSYVVFNEAYSNKPISIDVVDKGVLTFTLYNYDVQKCTQKEKKHQNKIAIWTKPKGGLANIPIEGNKISNLTIKYPDTEKGFLCFTSIISMFIPNYFFLIFKPEKHTLTFATCRHIKTIGINCYPSFKAKFYIGLCFEYTKETATLYRRVPRGVRILDVNKKDSGSKFLLGLEAEFGNDFKFTLDLDDPVIPSVQRWGGTFSKIKHIKDQIANFLNGRPDRSTPLGSGYSENYSVSGRNFELKLLSFTIGGEVEAKLVGIKQKHEFKVFLSFEPLIGIVLKFDVLAWAARAGGATIILIELRDLCVREGWGDLYFRAFIEGEVSGSIELSHKGEVAGKVIGKITVGLELGLKITSSNVEIEASGKLSGGIYGEGTFDFENGIAVSVKVGNEKIGLTAIFKVKVNVRVIFLGNKAINFEETLDIPFIEKDQLLCKDLGKHTIC